MQLESTYSPCMIYAAFYTVTKCTCFIMTIYNKNNLFRVTYRTYSNRKGCFRNLIRIIIKETRIYNQCIFCKSTRVRGLRSSRVAT